MLLSLLLLLVMDVYHKLLGIPPNEQPPTHYRLLAVEPFETDREVIANAARARCQFVKSVSLTIPELTEPVLDAIMTAKRCLLDPVQRAAYDRELLAKQPAPKLASASQAEAPSGIRHAVPLGSDAEEAAKFETDSWMLAPARVAEPPKGREWVVGSGSQAAIRVLAPWVSRRHCRIWEDASDAWIEDLGSTNGTFVNEVPIEGPTRLQAADYVTLGRKTRLPWPLPPECTGRDLRVYSIGRAPDCDYVLDDKSVSQHHAQLLIEGEVILLQDLDSLNGTRVGSLTNRISACELPEHVSVYFGAAKVFAQALIQAVRKR
ncbi:FHA domain-containing protein [Botrimarina mediterranea]|uniref:FHA domain-containing protein n=1 Tax=Botrimarina mediterranea TaxID=2528022 RepID=UPI0011A69B30